MSDAYTLGLVTAVVSSAFTWMLTLMWCDRRRNKELDKLWADQKERAQRTLYTTQEQRLQRLEGWKRDIDARLAKGRSESA